MVVGDHLRVPRQHGLFYHHGIDLGDGTVAHYLEGRKILRSSLQEFSAGQRLTIVIHPKCSPKSVILRRAISRIGEEKYNLLFNNCEHFANWCKTGIHRCDQIEELLKDGKTNSLLIGKLFPGIVCTGLNLLLSKGLDDKTSRIRANAMLKNLEKLSSKIRLKLEMNLKEIENWIHHEISTNEAKAKSQIKQTLLLKGQLLEDQLNTIENVEAQITNLLNKADSQI